MNTDLIEKQKYFKYKLKYLKEQLKQNNHNYFLGGTFSDTEERALKKRTGDLEKKVKKLEEAYTVLYDYLKKQNIELQKVHSKQQNIDEKEYVKSLSNDELCKHKHKLFNEEKNKKEEELKLLQEKETNRIQDVDNEKNNNDLKSIKWHELHLEVDSANRYKNFNTENIDNILTTLESEFDKIIKPNCGKFYNRNRFSCSESKDLFDKINNTINIFNTNIKDKNKMIDLIDKITFNKGTLTDEDKKYSSYHKYFMFYFHESANTVIDLYKERIKFYEEKIKTLYNFLNRLQDKRNECAC